MNTLYKHAVDQKHQWVTVVNPLNQRTLLQACDGCGVVKSENSIMRSCTAKKGVAMITSALTPSARAC